MELIHRTSAKIELKNTKLCCCIKLRLPYQLEIFEQAKKDFTLSKKKDAEGGHPIPNIHAL